MKSVELPLYQRVSIRMVIIDQEGFWSSKKEGCGEVIFIKKDSFIFFFIKDIEVFLLIITTLFLPLNKDIEIL